MLPLAAPTVHQGHPAFYSQIETFQGYGFFLLPGIEIFAHLPGFCLSVPWLRRGGLWQRKPRFLHQSRAPPSLRPHGYPDRSLLFSGTFHISMHIFPFFSSHESTSDPQILVDSVKPKSILRTDASLISKALISQVTAKHSALFLVNKNSPHFYGPFVN